MSGSVITKQRYEANCPECDELYIYNKEDFYQAGFQGFLNQRCDECQNYFTVYIE